MRGTKGLWSSIFPRSTARRTCGAAKNSRLKLEVLEDRRLLSLSVGNTVWNDLDGNGIQNVGESGVSGAVVEVYRSADTTIGNSDDVLCGQATTDASGNYSLGGLAAGTNYYLNFRAPVGYAFTTQNAGTDPALDSDANAQGFTALFTLGAEENRVDLNAGLTGTAPSFGFALGAGGTSSDYGQAVAVDAAGNEYVTGYFQGTVDFDAGPGMYNLTVAGPNNSPAAFIAKYTSGGALCWARSIDGLGSDFGYGIALDASDNVYATGSYSSTVDFDPGPGVFNLTSAGYDDIFISKLDSAGNFVWAGSVGGSSGDFGHGIEIGPGGSIYVTGRFANQADFDPGTEICYVTSNSNDAFVLKLDAACNFVWARNLGGSYIDYSYGLAVESDGSVYTTGNFQYTADFDPSPETYYLTSAGDYDIFVSKLDTNGNFAWARRFGGSSSDIGYGIALGPDGGVYTTGYFQNTADFDPGPGVNNLVSSSGQDVFVSKLDSAGAFVWARGMGGSSIDVGYSIAVDSLGNAYTTGSFRGTADFNPSAGTFNLTSKNGSNSDVFLSILDSAGNFTLAAGMGGTYNDAGNGIALAADGICLTGTFQSTADFDPRSGTFNLSNPSSSYTDAFVAKILTNHAPADITLSGASVALPTRTGVVVGQIAASDPDAGENFTFEMVNDAGGRFTLGGSQVRVLNPSAIEPAASYDITLRVRDAFGFAFEKTFAITATNLPTCTVGDRVWNDLDGDGSQDAGEPGMAGLIVGIFQSVDAIAGNADDIFFGETVTDAEGNYSLTNIPQGSNYFLNFHPGVGFSFTAQDAGSDEAQDNDVGSTGVTSLFSLVPGDNRTDLDAGVIGALPGFGFAAAASGTGADYGQAVALDSAGNVYVIGHFQGTTDFDPGPGVYNLTSFNNSYTDAFIAKYSNEGTLCWVKGFGGANEDNGYGIAADGLGNIFATGSFQSTTDFDPGAGTLPLTAAGSSDVFVLKLDTAGNLVWARAFGGSGNDRSRGLALAPDGGMCITGSFIGTADFDPGAGSYNLTSAGGQDIFVAKLTADGNFAWAGKMGGAGDDVGYAIAVAADGSMYTTGSFNGTADIDPGLNTFNLLSAGNTDIFLSKLDVSGNHVWAYRFGGTGYDYGYGITISSDGYVFVTGNFSNTVDFNPGLDESNLVSVNGSRDVFVLKMDTAGNFAWARGMGGLGTDVGSSVVVDQEGSVFTVGYYQYTVDFDPGPGTFNFTGSYGNNLFVSKLNAAGDFAMATGMSATNISSGSSYSYGYGAALSPDGAIYFTGSFEDTVDFDPRAGTFNLTSASSTNDIFLAKYLPNFAPTDIGLSNTIVTEPTRRGVVVGELSGFDPDSNENFTYEMLNDAGGRFMLTGALLRVADSEALDLGAAYDIQIRIRDSVGYAYVKTFTIGVANLPACTVGDRVWNDLNGNGIQDTDEPGMAGVIVEIFHSIDTIAGNADDVSFGQTMTDAAGDYSLTNIPGEGNYYLVFHPAVGYAFTAPNAGGDDAQDSDADASGVTGIFAIESGVDRTDLDAGVTGAVPSFGFAVGMGGTLADYGQAVAADSAGNTYVAGYFQGTVDFDAGPGVYNLTATTSSSSAFVAKYSSDGALSWARAFVGTGSSSGYGVAVDGSGNVYSTGSFLQTVDFDPGLGTFNLISAGDADVFVAKFDPSGNLLWARSAGGTGTDNGRAVAVTPSGGVAVTGSFAGMADFGPGLDPRTLTSAGGSDIFVWKLDSLSEIGWARRMGGTGSDVGYGVAVFFDGSIYTTGSFNGSADFNPDSAVTNNLTSAGSSDIFVSKLDASGSYLWAGAMGGTAADCSYGIALSPDGAAYTTGGFQGTADFNPGTDANTLTSASSGSPDVFISKLDPAGNYQWARSLSGTNFEYGYSIAVDAAGNAYTTGYFNNTVDFDPSTGTFNLTTSSGNTFVSKLDAGGNFVSATSIGGSSVVYGYGIALGPNDSVYLAGHYQSTADFDPRGGKFNITNLGSSDAFVMKLGPNLAPTDIALSHATVPAGSRRGSVIGTLSASDPDSNETFTYELSNSAGGRFMLSGSTVKVENAALIAQPGNYTITIRVRDSFGFAFEKMLSIEVAEEAGYSVGGRVWKDANNNGMQDAAEQDLKDAVVEVWQSIDGTIGNADDFSFGYVTTNDAGVYSINGLVEGTNYYLITRTPSGYAFTAQDAGGDDLKDSDVNASGTTGFFSLSSGVNPANLDAGVVGAAPAFGFAIPVATSTSEFGKTVGVDALGNIYVTGCFSGGVDFDPGPGIYNVPNVSYTNVLVAKYTSVGTLCWARGMGAPGTNDYGYAIAVDAAGNSYVTGTYQATADFDPGPGTYNLANAGGTDVFIVKLDVDGNFVWARGVGGASADTATGIAVDGSGNAYITGAFQATVDFDPNAGTTPLTSAGIYDIFVLKLDSAGNFGWVRGAGGSNSEQGKAIAVTNDGYVYATGVFLASVDFDPGPGTANLTSAGNNDVFVWKLDPAGNYVWARKMGGSNSEYCYGIAVTSAGDVYTTGNFYGTVDFNPGTNVNNLVSLGYSSDIFISKLDSGGNYVWAAGFGSESSDVGYGIATFPDGSVCASGFIGGTVDFDPGIGVFNVLTKGVGSYGDFYVLKLDSAGNFTWATGIGGTGTDQSNAIAVGPDGSVMVTGGIQSTVDFDPRSSTLNLTTANTVGYLFKLASDNPPNDIALTHTNVPVNCRRGSVVGQLTATDPDQGESFTYALVDSAGGRFSLLGTSIRVEDPSLLTLNPSYNIVVRAIDSLGMAFQKTLTITITNDSMCSITGRVWHDANSNGVQDDGEPSMAGAVVQAYQSTDALIDNADDYYFTYAVTDAYGAYTLDRLLEGVNYYLAIRTPAGYGFTAQDAGSDDAIDSDVNSSGVTALFSLSRDGGPAHQDAGLAGAAPDFGFALRAGNSANNPNAGKIVKIDGEGYVYVAGNFVGTMDFDSGPRVYNLISSSQYSSDYSDAFLAKYTSAGALCWAIGITGRDDEYIGGIVFDSQNNVFVSGTYGQTVDFDPGLGVYELTSAGGTDSFIAKYDSTGNFGWVKSIGGANYDTNTGLAMTSSNLYLLEYFDGAVDCDPGTSTQDGTGTAVLKLDLSGNFVWVRNVAQASTAATASSIALDGSGNIYLVGRFDGTVSFGPTGSVSLASNGDYDVFVASMNSSGSLRWAVNLGGAGEDNGYDLVIDSSFVYVTGSFVGMADFSPGAGIYNLSSNGITDVFISKLNTSNGSNSWAKNIGSVRDDYGYGITVDSSHNVYISGMIGHTADFDPGTGTYFLTPANSAYAGFMMKLDSNGNFLSVDKIDTTINMVWVYDVAVASSGTVYTTGSYYGTADFDPWPSKYDLKASGIDIFFSALLPKDRAPTAIVLSNTTIPLGSRRGSLVGQLSAIDLDPLESFTYDLTNSAGGLFMLDGTCVRLANPSMLSQGGSYNIIVRVRDSLGVAYQKSLTITVSNDPTSSLGNRVWNDMDNDGTQDPGEPGVAGAVVDLYQSLDTTYGNADDFLVGQVASGADGGYLFNGVISGDHYYLVFHTPVGFEAFAMKDAGDDTLDSDAGSAGTTAMFAVSSGVDRLDIDAGLLGAAPVSGFSLSVTNSAGRSVVVDAEGNFYVTGSFRYHDFDPGPGMTRLTSDYFIAKYSSTGALYWAVTCGYSTANNDIGRDIALDNAGNVYVTGNFFNAADFDPGPGYYLLSSAGDSDAFVLKLDPWGKFVWMRNLGGTGSEDASAIYVVPDGSAVYTTGSFTGTADFNPGQSTNSLTSKGNCDIYISKLNSEGNYVWARGIGGTYYDHGYDITVDANQNVYVAGDFGSTVNFNPSGTTNLTAAGITDAFVMKLTKDGNLSWARNMGGNNSDCANGIAVNSLGQVYTTGSFVGTADFDPGAGYANLSTTGESGAFISKLDASGNHVWARGITGSGNGFGQAISLDNSGNVYTTGRASGMFDFDPGPETLNINTYTVFVSRLDPDGNFGLATGRGGDYYESGYGIVIAADGSIITSESTYYLRKLSPNHVPADITLSPSVIPQGVRSGSVIGQLAAADPDPNQTFTFELLDSAGGRVRLEGTLLRIDNAALVAQSGDFDIVVRVRDNFNVAYEKTLTISVTSENACVLGDRVWNDTNGNGLQDAGERGMPGVVVEVYQSADATYGNADDYSLGYAVTDGLGNYTLDGLAPWQNYYLVFRIPAGYAFTASHAGTDDTIDSDVDASGRTSMFALTLGVNELGLDAGVTGSSPNFGFACGFGGTGSDVSYAVASDAEGNVYFTGYVSSTVDFDPGPGIYSLGSSGSTVFFVAKVTSIGALCWIDTYNSVYHRDIAFDDAGDIYLTGSFSSSGGTDFDPGPGVFKLASNNGSSDIFITKLNPSGKLLWVRVIGGTDSDDGDGIGVDASGNVYVTGNYYNVDFDPGPDECYLDSLSGIFLAKFDTQGNFLWVTLPGIGYSQDLALDDDGNVYTVGRYYGTVDFDPGLDVYNLTPVGYYDVYVSKLDSEGNFLWARSVGGPDYDYGNGIAIDSEGGAYITGYYSSTVDFNPGSGVCNLTSNGSAEIFILKLDSAGNFAWAKSFGSTGSDTASGIAVDSDDNVYTTGSFVGNVDFDPGEGVKNLVSAGNGDVFVSVLDSAGNYVNAIRAGAVNHTYDDEWGVTTMSDSANAIAISPDGSLFLIGRFEDVADFDPGPGIYNPTSSPSLNYDIFLWKVRNNHAPVAHAGGPYVVGYGESLALNGTQSSDPDFMSGDYIVSYAWDIGADGTFELTGPSPTLGWSQLSSLPYNTDIPMQLLVTDRSGATGTISTTLRVVVPLATVESVVLNDGFVQRSMISGLTIDFNTLVTIQEGAVEVNRINADGTLSLVGATIVIATVDDHTRITLQFNGSQSEFGSLIDGNYQLIIHGDKVHDVACGQALDGDENGQPGGDYLFGDLLFDGFFRFFGDSDGDRDVDNLDFARFRHSYNKLAGDPDYQAFFDGNADGAVNSLDFSAFRVNYLTRLPSYAPAGALANLTLTLDDNGVVHLYQTGTTIDAASSTSPAGESAASPLAMPSQTILCDTLTVDFSHGNPIPENGVNFSGNSLQIVGSSAEDEVLLADGCMTWNGSAPLYFNSASDFSFDLGEGDNSLTLGGTSLTLHRDDAISAGTNVTVDGGTLDFNGHSSSIGTLFVLNGGQAKLAGILNETTTVESGTLSATSIVCDSLTIGSPSSATTNTPAAKQEYIPALPFVETPQAITTNLVTEELVERTDASSTETTGAVVMCQLPIDSAIETMAIAEDAAPNPLAEEVIDTTSALLPAVVKIYATAELAPPVNMPVQPAQLHDKADFVQLLVEKRLNRSPIVEASKAMNSEYRPAYSFSQPDLNFDRQKELLDSDWVGSVGSSSKPSPNIAYSAHRIAIQSIVTEHERTNTVAQATDKLHSSKKIRREVQCSEKAVDEILARLIACD